LVLFTPKYEAYRLSLKFRKNSKERRALSQKEDLHYTAVQA